MKLNEVLETLQAKQEYRELVKQYHTDMGGDHNIMTDINTAKDLGDEALHKLFLKLKGIKKPVNTESGTEKKTITTWVDEIIKHYPGLMGWVETNADGSPYVRLIYRAGGEVVVKYVMNVKYLKSQSELARKMKEVLLGK